jgi:hypothetical protein
MSITDVIKNGYPENAIDKNPKNTMENGYL